MTLVQIDASLFSASGEALGRISGPLEFELLPRAGEVLSLLFASNGAAAPASVGSLLHLKVANVLHTPGLGGTMLMLEDIVAESRGVAKELVAYLSAGFDLFFEPHGENPL
jgi:hypothetical protein